jgi:hypothetical protein
VTTSTIIAMLVGLGIPAVVALVTKETLPLHLKALLTLFLTTAAGVLSGIASSPPSNLSEWEHVVVNIVLAYMSAAAATIGTWAPTGLLIRISRATQRFGIGKRQALDHRGVVEDAADRLSGAPPPTAS